MFSRYIYVILGVFLVLPFCEKASAASNWRYCFVDYGYGKKAYITDLFQTPHPDDALSEMEEDLRLNQNMGISYNCDEWEYYEQAQNAHQGAVNRWQNKQQEVIGLSWMPDGVRGKQVYASCYVVSEDKTTMFMTGVFITYSKRVDEQVIQARFQNWLLDNSFLLRDQQGRWGYSSSECASGPDQKAVLTKIAKIQSEYKKKLGKISVVNTAFSGAGA